MCNKMATRDQTQGQAEVKEGPGAMPMSMIHIMKDAPD